MQTVIKGSIIAKVYAREGEKLIMWRSISSVKGVIKSLDKLYGRYPGQRKGWKYVNFYSKDDKARKNPVFSLTLYNADRNNYSIKARQ